MTSLLRRLRSDESGFTLAEVVVSIVIVGLLGLSSAYLAIRGTQTSNSQQVANLATTVAVQAMEDVIARQSTVEPLSGVTALVGGRDTAAVATAWSAYGEYEVLASMYPLPDPTAAAGATQRLPIERTVTLDNTEFTVATLIGSCYRSGTSGDCTRIAGLPNRPATAPSGRLEAIRVAVIVEWTAGGGCQADPCSYELVTMIDINRDVEWVTSG